MGHVLLSMQVHRLCWCDVVHLVIFFTSNPSDPRSSSSSNRRRRRRRSEKEGLRHRVLLHSTRRARGKQMEGCTSRVHSMLGRMRREKVIVKSSTSRSKLN